MKKNDYLKHKGNLGFLKEFALRRDRNNKYFHGPLPLTEATQQFDYLVKSLLNNKRKVTFIENNKEVIAMIEESSRLIGCINVTGVLLAEPDLEYLSYSSEELDEFLRYLGNKKEGVKPKLNSGLSAGKRGPSIDKIDFSAGERAQGIDEKILHQGEKLAINMYTSDFYKEINKFFRANGREYKPGYSTAIKDILLVGALSTAALSKLRVKEDVTEAFRVDGRSTILKRIEGFEKNFISYEKSFYSTSDYKKPTNFEKSGNSQIDEKSISFHFVVDNYQGQLIKAYSNFPGEEEVLFGIGTKFAPLVYAKEGDVFYFVYKPIRALGIKNNPEVEMAFVDLAKEKMTMLPLEQKVNSSTPAINQSKNTNGVFSKIARHPKTNSSKDKDLDLHIPS